MTTVYGITNCDNVRKARRWLDDRAITYQFHDFRKEGLSRAQLYSWASRVDWQQLLNKRGRTFRNLDAEQTTNLTREAALVLMLEHPTLIKRPVVDVDGRVLVGFDDALYRETFEK